MPENNPNKIINKQKKRLISSYDETAKELSRLLYSKKVKLKEPLWSNNKILYDEVNKILKTLNDDIVDNINTGLVDSWELSEKRIDKITYEYIAGENISTKIIQSWTQPNVKALNGFVNRSVNGLGISGRVWNNTLHTRKLIEKIISSGILEGRSAAQMSLILKQGLKNPNALYRRVRNPETEKLELSGPAKNYHPGQGVYRSAYKNALRLAGTEINMAYRYSDFNRVQTLPFVTGIRVNLSAAHPEYDICDPMAGVYPKTFLFTGWHPNCFCYSTTELLPKEKFKSYLNTGKIPTDEYRKRIPISAERYLTNNFETLTKAKTTPYFIRENFKKVNNDYVFLR